MAGMLTRLVLSLLIIVLAVFVIAGVVVGARVETFYISLEDGVVKGGHVEWLPCNGSLVPFYRYVFVAPPGFKADVVKVKPVVVTRFTGSLLAAGVAVPLRGSTQVYRNIVCRAPIVEEGYWRGIEITVVLYPMVIDKSLLVKRLEIVFNVTRGPSKIVALTRQDVELLQKLADNLEVYEIPATLPPGSRGIIIVTRDYFMPVVEEWAKLKEMQGYRVKIIDIDRDICTYKALVAEYGLRRLIRDYIKKAYEECKGCYQYLLIVGDTSGLYWDKKITNCSELPEWMVPTAYFYNPADPLDLKYSHSGYFVPSDVYYATLDGDWDANGNGILGEYPQDVKAYDPYPELAYARIPVRTLTEAKQVLEKLENVFPSDHKVDLIGSILYYLGENGNDTQAQGDTRVEIIYEEDIKPLNWLESVRLYEHYPPLTTVVSPGGLNGNLTVDNVRLVLSEARRMVLVMAHGDKLCLWRKIWVNDANNDGVPEPQEIEYKPFLCASDAPNVKQQLLYLVDACLTAYFDSPDSTSLGEAMLLYGSQYIGSDRISFVTLLPPGEATDPNNWVASDLLYYYIVRYLFDTANKKVARIGDALVNAIVEYVTHVPLTTEGFLGNVSRRVFFSLTYLGDPTRMIYSTPTRLNTTRTVLALQPNSLASFAVQLLREDGEPVPQAPIYLYDVTAGDYILLSTQFTNDEGVALFHVNVDNSNRTLYAYYPGSASIPNPLEPSGMSILIVPIVTKPWIQVKPQVYKPGERLSLYGCGFPYNAPLEVYMDGIYVTKIYSNSTGCVNATIIPLYNLLPPSTVSIEVIYPAYPEIRASATFTLAYNPLLGAYGNSVYLRSRLDELYTMLQAIYNGLLKLDKQLALLETNITAKLSRVNNTLNSLTRLMASVASNVSSIERSLSMLRSLLGRLNATMGENAARLTRLLELVTSIEKHIEYVRFEIARLNSSIVQRSEGIYSRLAGLEAKLSALGKMLEGVRSEIIDMIESVNATLTSRLEALNGSLEALSARLSSIAVTVSRLAVRLSRLETRVSNVTRDISAKLENISMSLAETRSALSARIDSVRTAITELEKSITRKYSELQSILVSSVESLREALASLKTEVERIGYVSYIIMAMVVSVLGFTLWRRR